MTTETKARDSIWLNPIMLKWAREWRGRTIEQAAARVKKSPETIIGWEQNQGTPTVKQARKLAQFYDRSFLEFFLSEPPALRVPTTIPDFRMHAGVQPLEDNWEIRHIRQWAETQRENALVLLGELGDQPAEIPSQLFATLKSDPSNVANRAREALGFSIHDQFKLGSRGVDALPRILRERLEAIGLLTLKQSSMKGLGIRGICLAVYPLPVIVFRNEAPTAQASTTRLQSGGSP